MVEGGRVSCEKCAFPSELLIDGNHAKVWIEDDEIFVYENEFMSTESAKIGFCPKCGCMLPRRDGGGDDA